MNCKKHGECTQCEVEALRDEIMRLEEEIYHLNTQIQDLHEILDSTPHEA